ncbi:MAG: radical SAM protein [Lachnospiraceae bacterium]
MKLSKYNLCISSKGKWLIYNLLKSTCVILNEKEFNSFLNMSSENDVITFNELGMYVDDGFDELSEMFYFYQRNTDLYNQNCRKHRIYTTTKCNAKCYYCFEKDLIRETMNISIADKVIERIINKQGNARQLTITWFGGEPLLNMDIMDYISCELKQKLPSDVKYNTFMITNGMLFDEITIRRAIDIWNLDSVQITIDGLKETYEGIKKFGIKNSFERIINNIHCLMKAGIKVRVRINYNDDNISEILDLIDYLSLEFIDKSLLFVYAHRIFSDDEEDNSKIASEDNDIIIWDRLYSRGFINDILATIKPNMISCTAGSLYNEMYLPNGDIGKCAQAISKGDIVGDVCIGVKNNLVSKWCCGLMNKECMLCKLFPVCGGGCKYEKFNQKNGCFTSERLLKHKLLVYLNESLDEEKIG